MTAKKFVDYLFILIGYLLILIGSVGMLTTGGLTLYDLFFYPSSEAWQVLPFVIVFVCGVFLVSAIIIFGGFKILSIWKKRWSLLANITSYSILAIVILGFSFYLYQDSITPPTPPVDPNHLYDLYKADIGSDPSSAYRSLCISADNGHPLARYTLGDTFEYDKQNYVQAFVWYSLSGIVDEGELQSFVDKNLSTEEYSNAKKTLKEWQPGQCEQELGLVQDTQ